MKKYDKPPFTPTFKFNRFARFNMKLWKCEVRNRMLCPVRVNANTVFIIVYLSFFVGTGLKNPLKTPKKIQGSKM